MAKLWRLYFANVDKEYNGGKNIMYVKKRMPQNEPDKKKIIGADGTLIVLEKEIKDYWEYGEGAIKCELVGELDDSYLKPVLFEPDFVDNQIKSKKNGEIVGYQG